jgi:hypothetical protein
MMKLFVRRPDPKVRPTTVSRTSIRSALPRTAKLPASWHAVGISTKSGSCELACSRRGSRFLSAEAPQLPLVGCASPQSCPCTYRHFEDRRGPSRRAEDNGQLAKAPKEQGERRNKPDRRKKDEAFDD